MVLVIGNRLCYFITEYVWEYGCVNMCVCIYGYALSRTLRYGADTWRGVGGGQTRFRTESIFSKRDPTEGQKSSRVQIALEMPYGHRATRFSKKNPWPKCNALLGSKVIGRLNRGQPAVKLFGSILCIPNLVWRSLDRSVVLWWRQSSCKVQLRSTRG